MKRPEPTAQEMFDDAEEKRGGQRQVPPLIASIPLSEVLVAESTQTRAAVDEATVERYAEALIAGERLPPVIVFGEGPYHLADGFHRYRAHERAGFPRIPCEIRRGGKREAFRFALGANHGHGLPRTRADRRRAVELAFTEDEETAALSDRQIAQLCRVGYTLVAEVRAEAGARYGHLTRVGLDGKEYPAKPAPRPPRPSSQPAEKTQAAVVESSAPNPNWHTSPAGGPPPPTAISDLPTAPAEQQIGQGTLNPGQFSKTEKTPVPVSAATASQFGPGWAAERARQDTEIAALEAKDAADKARAAALGERLAALVKERGRFPLFFLKYDEAAAGPGFGQALAWALAEDAAVYIALDPLDLSPVVSLLTSLSFRVRALLVWPFLGVGHPHRVVRALLIAERGTPPSHADEPFRAELALTTRGLPQDLNAVAGDIAALYPQARGLAFGAQAPAGWDAWPKTEGE